MSHPPLNLLYLGAVLVQEGHKVEILDYLAKNISIEQLENFLTSSDAVGITFIDNFKPAADISRTVKKINPKIPLIIGGSYCTFLPKQSLSNIPDADISVVGEGEQVILDIVKFLQGRKRLSDIHGIYYRDKNSIKSGRIPQVIDNLDALPFPARHLVEKYDYGISPWNYKLMENVTALISSRGCPFSCRFCAKYGNVIKDWKFRERSAENVVNEIQELDGKYRSVVIVDDNFLADKKRAHKIFDMLLESNIDIEFFVEGARVDTADRDLYLKMKKAGVKTVLYGLESGNQEVLDFYNKNITLQQIRYAMRLAREMNFFIYTGFIIGAPIETKKQIENTIRFACSLPIDLVNFGVLAYLIGSSLWVEAVKDKKISPYEYATIADSSNNLGNFTKDELINYVIKANKDFYFRPKYILEQIYRSFLRHDFRLLLNGLKYLTIITKWRKNSSPPKC
jgi:anaerobic magnesium-protoporphyrin IX monomethyl ester cyclase